MSSSNLMGLASRYGVIYSARAHTQHSVYQMTYRFGLFLLALSTGWLLLDWKSRLWLSRPRFACTQSITMKIFTIVLINEKYSIFKIQFPSIAFQIGAKAHHVKMLIKWLRNICASLQFNRKIEFARYWSVYGAFGELCAVLARAHTAKHFMGNVFYMNPNN